MKITIDKVTNGYVITFPVFIDNSPGDGYEEPRSIVIEEKDTELGEHEAFVSLCWQIHELFGIPSTKHNSRHLKIELTSKEEV